VAHIIQPEKRSIVHRAIFVVLLLASVLTLSGIPATARPDPSIPQGDRNEGSRGPRIPEDMLRDMAKKANQQRQANLKKDAEKLLKLSTELNEYVDKTNENILSLDVIKKADEIEKLAHSVKVKMRGDNYGIATP
jgi:hypothetical protein